jgi:plasmid maintenance system antidote protein VapI
MKSLKNIEKEYTPEEIAESFVFPGPKDPKERESLMEAFRQHRKKVSDKQSERTKLISQLLQLKFLIEDYIKSEQFNKEYFFGFFLKEYITRLEKKNNQFADEINVDPAELSQVINKRRQPTEKLIFRLEIHSNRNFPALMWFKILEKDRAYELKHHREIIDSEKKNVKQKLEFSL